MPRVLIGTAGWSIPRQQASHFPDEGSALERYATRFDVAEINSSFHRPHRLSTWERWRDSVPDRFRFSVKLPKQTTHVQKLVGCSEALDAFFAGAGALGQKLGVLLVQLPPSLDFNEQVAADFFAEVAARSAAQIACEPRHRAWFTAAAGALLESLKVARVAADPAICAGAASPGGWPGLRYWRLHGSPVKYRSSYADRIPAYADELASEATVANDVWCILDNTASSAALGDAMALIDAVGRQ